MPVFGPDVKLEDPAYIHPTAHLYGKVTVREQASIWINVAARAENYDIVIGPYTNIQDFTMIHTGAQTGSHIGAWCSITHHCTIHGCTIGDNCLIGINATIMDGAVIGKNCIVGEHSLVRPNTVIPDNSVVVGSPAKPIKEQNSYVRNKLNAWLYWKNALAYAKGEYRAWTGPDYAKAVADQIKVLEAELAALSKA
ncbi:gamma carbonic anhydrase family protein [Desertibaculum subflavum]|uniref:gamma carbonic anhydrase family protein n=1 Tax=Desertibaculum subflavum TaxID=2268458 RepID=UPI000E66F541